MQDTYQVVQTLQEMVALVVVDNEGTRQVQPYKILPMAMVLVVMVRLMVQHK